MTGQRIGKWCAGRGARGACQRGKPPQFCIWTKPGPFGQRDVAVFGAFAVADVNHHPGAVDVGHAQIGAFLQAQPAGVDGGETNLVARQSETA